jgi:hypothetical protein
MFLFRLPCDREPKAWHARLLNQNDVAAALTRNLPTELSKYTDGFAPADEGNLWHLDRDFNL